MLEGRGKVVVHFVCPVFVPSLSLVRSFICSGAMDITLNRSQVGRRVDLLAAGYWKCCTCHTKRRT